MSKITNTEEQVRQNPILGLFIGMTGGIEEQEKQGQSQLVQSEQLPTDVRPEDKEFLQSLGVKFLNPCIDDPIFTNVTLPDGWGKKATDHHMWSHLLNADGEEVASIFYKAAYYDRSSHMHVSREFRILYNIRNSDSCIHPGKVLVDNYCTHSYDEENKLKYMTEEGGTMSPEDAANFLNGSIDLRDDMLESIRNAFYTTPKFVQELNKIYQERCLNRK